MCHSLLERPHTRKDSGKSTSWEKPQGLQCRGPPAPGSLTQVSMQVTLGCPTAGSQTVALALGAKGKAQPVKSQREGSISQAEVGPRWAFLNLKTGQPGLGGTGSHKGL